MRIPNVRASAVSTILAFGSVLSLSLQVSADLIVEDPKQVLGEITRDFQMGSFADEMSCRQTAAYLAETNDCQLRCTAQYCSSRCADEPEPYPKFNMNIDDCSAEGAFLYSDRGLVVELRKDRWLPENGYFIRPLLEKMNQFVSPEGTLTIESSWPKSVSVIEQGRVQSVFARVVEFKIQNGPGLQTETGWLMLNPSERGLKRIMGLGLGWWEGTPSTFLRIRGLLPYKPPGSSGLGPLGRAQ